MQLTRTLFMACAFTMISVVPACAQYYEDIDEVGVHEYSQGATGDYGRVSLPTAEGPEGMGGEFALATMPQMTAMAPTMSGQIAPKFGPRGRNGLPVTSLDSFVKNAGAFAEQIYGDEGADGLPQIEKFKPENRINFGIVAARASGLTTGHGSVLPNAWGSDKKTGGTEWSMSGSPYPVQTVQIKDVSTNADYTGGSQLNWDLGL